MLGHLSQQLLASRSVAGLGYCIGAPTLGDRERPERIEVLQVGHGLTVHVDRFTDVSV